MSKRAEETLEEKKMRKRKEEKELAKWKNEKKKPIKKTYYWYLLLILSLISIIDEVTANIGTQMQSLTATYLFEGRLSIMSLLQIFSLPTAALAIFFKAKSDKYGRKLFLFINIFCMGMGLFLTFFAGQIGGIPGIITYILSMMIVNFSITGKMQVVYIMETAPQGKRATTYATVKAIANAGVVLIPIFREIFMGDNPEKWHMVYLLPAILALVLSLIFLLTARESEMFLENRIKYLEMSDIERQEMNKESNNNSSQQGGLGNALRFAFAHKQLRWLFIVGLIYIIGSMGTAYYEAMLNVFFDTAGVTTVLLFLPFANAVVTFAAGWLGDHEGRKMTNMLSMLVSFFSFLLFYIGCIRQWNPAVIGIMLGSYIGSYYACSDSIGSIMISESSPTNLRASMLSAMGIFHMIGGIVSRLFPIIVLLVSGDNYRVLGLAIIMAAVPTMFFACIFFIKNVGDTTQININTVRGDEWD